MVGRPYRPHFGETFFLDFFFSAWETLGEKLLSDCNTEDSE